MFHRPVLAMLAAVSVGLSVATDASAQETVKIGLILPLTGPFTPTGRQIEAGARLYMQQHGDSVAGRKIELIVKDDGNVADATKRIAQELVVNDKVKDPRRLRPDAARARHRADRDRGQGARRS